MATTLRTLGRYFGGILLCIAASGCTSSPVFDPTSITTSLLAGGALQRASVERALPVEQALAVCPGPGSSACEKNWMSLKQGWTAEQVLHWLGEPLAQVGPDIYVDRVVAEWQFESAGVVYFENAQLRYIDIPAAFEYPL